MGHNLECLELIKSSGFNIFNLSNNHIMDFGIHALKETIGFLKDYITVGAGTNFEEAYKMQVYEKEEIKIGFLSYSEWGFGALTNADEQGYAWINHSKVNSLIRQNKTKVDFLVVQVHAGVEDTDLPLPEWRERYKLLIDHGADLIVGHHPHVPQGWEQYKEKYIYYSLGNFYSSRPKYKTKLNKNFVLEVIFLSLTVANH